MRLPNSFYVLAVPFWAFLAVVIGFLLISIVVLIAERALGYDLGAFWTMHVALQALIALTAGAPLTVPIARGMVRNQRHAQAVGAANAKAVEQLQREMHPAPRPGHAPAAHHADAPTAQAHGAAHPQGGAHHAKKEF